MLMMKKVLALLVMPALVNAELIVGDLGGQKLTPGVYTGGACAQSGSPLELDDAGVVNPQWTFECTAAFTTAASASVIFTNEGFSADNVLWDIGAAITLGAGAKMIGDLISVGAISIGADATWTGNLETPVAVGIGARTVVIGDVIAGGAITFGGDVIWTGNVTSTAAAVTVGANNKVNGDIYAGTTVTIGADSEVNNIIAKLAINLGASVTAFDITSTDAGAITLGDSDIACVITSDGAISLGANVETGSVISTSGVVGVGESGKTGSITTNGAITLGALALTGDLTQVDAVVTVGAGAQTGTISTTGVQTLGAGAEENGCPADGCNPNTVCGTVVTTPAAVTTSPSTSPTASPNASPTASPNASPTASPNASPTASPNASPTASPNASPTASPNASPTASPNASPTASPTDKFTTSKTGGDPHFVTWSGKKFDYHGVCDLVLVNQPSFDDGQGLRVHIRTKSVKYFSFIETVAVQIGSDTLVFSNDLDKYTINGSLPSKIQKNFLGGFEVKQFKSAIHISLDKKIRGNSKAHIDLFHRKNGFPYVVFDGKMSPELFDGSEGLLGDWTTGRMIGRDGQTEFETINGSATDYALEWQVRDTEPMLFSSARHPQFPFSCTPPEKMLGKRLGDTHMKKTAEEVCTAWGDDKDECIFDVMATRDVDSAHPLSRHGNFAMQGPVSSA
jgi:hypothetical protein